MEQKERREIIENAIGQLPPSQRETIFLRYFEEMSRAEIGELLNISEVAVKLRLNRGRKNLRKILIELGLAR